MVLSLVQTNILLHAAVFLHVLKLWIVWIFLSFSKCFCWSGRINFSDKDFLISLWDVYCWGGCRFPVKRRHCYLLVWRVLFLYLFSFILDFNFFFFNGFNASSLKSCPYRMKFIFLLKKNLYVIEKCVHTCPYQL